MKHWVIMLVAAALLGCSQPEEDVVAIYDGGRISVEAMDAFVLSLPAAERVVDVEDPYGWWEEKVRQALQEELLRNEMDLLGIRQDPQYQQIERTFVRDHLVSRWLRTAMPPPEQQAEAIQAMFEERSAQLQTPSGRLVSMIYLQYSEQRGKEETKALASRLFEQLNNGASFSKLAREWSDSDSALANGQLGWLKPGDLPQTLEHIIWNQTLRQPTEPLFTNHGAHIFVITDRRDEVSVSFDQAQPLLAREWLTQQTRRLVDERLEQAGQSLDIYIPEDKELIGLWVSGENNAVVMRVGSVSVTAGQLRALHPLESSSKQAVIEAVRVLADREIVFQLEFPGAGSEQLDPSAQLALQKYMLKTYKDRRTFDWLLDREDMLREYFETHMGLFQAPRKVAVEYFAVPMGEDPVGLSQQLRDIPEDAPTDVLEAQFAGVTRRGPLMAVSTLRQREPRVAQAVADVEEGHWSMPLRIADDLAVVRVAETEEAAEPNFERSRTAVVNEMFARQNAQMHERFTASLFERYHARIKDRGVRQLAGVSGQ